MKLYEQQINGEYVYTMDGEEIYRGEIGSWPPAIPVIREIRNRTELSLKDAKDIWDVRAKGDPPASDAKLRAAAPKLAEALRDLIVTIAGEQEDEGEIDKAFRVPGLGLGAKVNAGRDALRAAGIEVQG